MLVQRFDEGRLRLVEQHDHAVLSGELAAGWRLADGSASLPESVILAIALHDVGWRELDRQPRWNPQTGLPHDFMTFPRRHRCQAMVRGIDRVAELHPYAGVLVSLHHSELVKQHLPTEFLEEERRRGELLDALGDAVPFPSEIRRDLRHLRFFDHLSLLLCLSSPEVRPGSVPDWLSPHTEPEAEGYGAISVHWLDREQVEFSPYPFAERELVLEVEHRELEGSPYRSSQHLRRAWKNSKRGCTRLRIGPADKVKEHRIPLL